MDTINVRKEDQILMTLVHYFVTKENYTPIYVHGVKDEIWLEKLDGPYRVIRINSNYIHNDEQFKFDQYKIKDILRQIKKKTMSFSVNALNINLNANDRVTAEGLKHIDNIKINSIEALEKNKGLQEIFPGIVDNIYSENDGLELILNITNDINAKTERDNKKFERIFAKKIPYLTYIIMFICVVMQILAGFLGDKFVFALATRDMFGRSFIQTGEVYRLITYAFLHGDLVHLLCNIYALFALGTQVENRYGKVKFLIIYFLSVIGSALLSLVFSEIPCIGASGAIFGLLGAIIYFGMQYRLYFMEVWKNNILPVLLLNLCLGLFISKISLAGHIGGLITGYLAAMLVGEDKSSKSDRINAALLIILFFGFLIFLLIR